MLTDGVEDASIAIYENVQVLLKAGPRPVTAQWPLLCLASGQDFQNTPCAAVSYFLDFE